MSALSWSIVKLTEEPDTNFPGLKLRVSSGDAGPVTKDTSPGAMPLVVPMWMRISGGCIKDQIAFRGVDGQTSQRLTGSTQKENREVIRPISDATLGADRYEVAGAGTKP